MLPRDDLNPWRSRCLHQEEFVIEPVFVAIAARATPVDHEKTLARLKGDERHVPDARAIVDALCTVGHEGVKLPG